MLQRWHELPDTFFRGAAAEGAVLLFSAKPDDRDYVSWLYANPLETLSLDDPGGIEGFLAEAEARRAHGRWLAGCVGFEAGYPLVGVEDPPVTDTPAAWFGVYDGAWRFDHRTGVLQRVGAVAEFPAETDASAGTNQPSSGSLPRFGPFGSSEKAYRAALERIHAYLSAGDTYQVNFTDRFEAEYEGDLLPVFQTLVASQPVPYAAFLNVAGTHGSPAVQIASLSPELFFRTTGQTVTTRPMKGTAPRGCDTAEDAALAEALRADEKTRAENVMIVDLLRNDLGRVCEHGSVRVPELFEVERYRTVQQMTSTVTGELREEVGMPELFGALFPCGSVTGAPKRRTMEIIRELERGPRGVYTGAIGHASPDGDMTFNVAIRTLVQMRAHSTRTSPAAPTSRPASDWHTTHPTPTRLVLGAGGGIVADSDPDAEYRECVLKARFATHPEPAFDLIETMRWEDDYRLLERHLARLQESAAYFGFAFDQDAMRVALRELAEEFGPGTVQRVGVRLPASGAFRLAAQPFRDDPSDGARTLRVALAEHRQDARDPFLRHKTTRRVVYDAARIRAEREGLADVLFLNERGELAEGAISNVFLEIGGELLTPPLDAGVLPGVYRAHVLATEPSAREAVLRPEDLASADRVLLCNALRGLREVAVVLAQGG